MSEDRYNSANAPTAPPPARPDAAATDDAGALATLLQRRAALYPAMRRDDCPQETFEEFLRVGGLIGAIQRRIGPTRFYAIKAEFNRQQPAPQAAATRGGGAR